MSETDSVLLVTREEWPLPVMSSTSSALPTAKRRDSPSLAVISYSPLNTTNMCAQTKHESRWSIPPGRA